MARSSVGFSDRYLTQARTTRRLFLNGAGLPRIVERTDSNGRVIRGFLLEAAAVQLARYTRALNSWTLTRVTVPTTDATAPDGTATADILHEDATAANTHWAASLSTAALVSGTTYCFSGYLKKGNRTWVALSPDSGSSYAYFNLNTGAVGTKTGNVVTSGIESVGGGWYRCWCTWAATASATFYAYYFVAETDNDVTFDGLNQDSLYVWGSQYEAGLIPSSHVINDGTSSVTRTADSNLWWYLPPMTSGEGTLQFEMMIPSHTPTAASTAICALTDGASNNVASYFMATTGYFRCGPTWATGTKKVTDGLVHDITISFKRARFTVWIDGVLDTVGELTDDTTALTKLYFYAFGGVVGQPVFIPKFFARPPRYVPHGGWR